MPPKPRNPCGREGCLNLCSYSYCSPECYQTVRRTKVFVDHDKARATKRKYSAAMRARYRANGVCITCWQEMAEPGKAKCRRCLSRASHACDRWRRAHPEHRVQNTLSVTARRHKRRAQGLCMQCGEPSQPYAYCFRHRVKNSASCARWRRDRAA